MNWTSSVIMWSQWSRSSTFSWPSGLAVLQLVYWEAYPKPKRDQLSRSNPKRQKVRAQPYHMSRLISWTWRECSHEIET
jgi:hypothetical protein